MSVRRWLISLACVLMSGCAIHSKAKPTETSISTASESQSEWSSEENQTEFLSNISHTIDDVRRDKIQNPVVQGIIEDAIVRLKKQKQFYDTVEYIFEIEGQENSEQFIVRVKEQYSDGVIERLRYTIELSAFTE
ncbi:hypothetical protein NHG25_05675 [Aerococcaceae bacterium NML191292]|nr:hypothetical protein [Aerococcaceae bacterium NML191292]MCW6675522.1 hypothetical protein [Aerococcaceae bacterium NML171108]MCW6682290.1 hypothetical protein [Aerococcaceae bacterium NML160702]